MQLGFLNPRGEMSALFPPTTVSQLLVSGAAVAMATDQICKKKKLNRQPSKPPLNVPVMQSHEARSLRIGSYLK